MVTGGAGFIGCNLVRHLLSEDPDVRVVVYDKLTYAGSRHNLAGLPDDQSSRTQWAQADICDRDGVSNALGQHDVDTIIHLAAESHVDRSIDAPDDFIQTNVVGTHVLLEAARARWQDRDDVRFHHVSTDEVFGSLGPTGAFHEETRYDPSSPYSATKAASDHLVRAWHRTFGLPVTLSNCSNNYGPYQYPEKLIPLMIQKALRDEPMPVYGSGANIRDWLHVEDHCGAIRGVVRQGRLGETYNIGGGNEWANIDLVHLLCDLLDKIHPRAGGKTHRDLITFVPDRPGHDLRYAMDSGKMERELGWRAQRSMEDGLRETIRWYLDHPDWVAKIAQDRQALQRRGLA